MQAIITKYHGPTDAHGSRITATSASGLRVTVGYDDALSSQAAHRQAAEALQKKLKWSGRLIGGGLKDGYAFVVLPSSCKCPAGSLDGARRRRKQGKR